MDLDQTLNDLGRRLGLGPFRLDERGVRSIEFDERFTVTLELDQSGETLHLYCALGQPPEDLIDRLGCFAALLEANLFGQGTGGDSLRNWKVKLRGGKIAGAGYSDGNFEDYYSAKKPVPSYNTYTFDDTFAKRFRRRAISQAAQHLRDSGLTINDDQFHGLRRKNLLNPPQFRSLGKWKRRTSKSMRKTLGTITRQSVY